jgi:hypothetical protein
MNPLEILAVIRAATEVIAAAERLLASQHGDAAVSPADRQALEAQMTRQLDRLRSWALKATSDPSTRSDAGP